MSHSKLDYGSYPAGLAMADLRHKYPEAHEVFKEELVGLD